MSIHSEFLPTIASYLSTRDAIQAAQVSQEWRVGFQSELNQRREATLTQGVSEERYPDALVALFQQHHRPIRELPVRDLRNDVRSRRDYIDWLTRADVREAPVMRVLAAGNRPGIAVRTEGHGEGGVTLADGYTVRYANMRHLFTIFQRYANEPDLWKVGAGPFCFINGFNSGDSVDEGAALSQLLAGSHPHLRIQQ